MGFGENRLLGGRGPKLPNSVRPQELRTLGPSLRVIGQALDLHSEILVFAVHKGRFFPLST
jgi:hypothetical protein